GLFLRQGHVLALAPAARLAFERLEPAAVIGHVRPVHRAQRDSHRFRCYRKPFDSISYGSGIIRYSTSVCGPMVKQTGPRTCHRSALEGFSSQPHWWETAPRNPGVNLTRITSKGSTSIQHEPKQRCKRSIIT